MSRSDAITHVEEPAWVAPIFEFVDVRLEEHPPLFLTSVERQEALMVLDGPLHLHEAPRFRSTLAFLRERMQRAIEEIEQWNVGEGARIWRLYNMGFVVRTPSASLGLDLVGGWRLESDEGLEYYGISEEWISRLADQLDVLTISHAHQDHMDPLLRDLLFERGMPVVVAPGIYEEFVDQPLLHRPDRGREPAALHSFNIPAAKDGGVAYPGHQGAEIPNNVYLVRTGESPTILKRGRSAEADAASTLHHHHGWIRPARRLHVRASPRFRHVSPGVGPICARDETVPAGGRHPTHDVPAGPRVRLSRPGADRGGRPGRPGGLRSRDCARHGDL